MRRFVKPVLLGAAGIAIAIQLVPYGWWHENPPVTQDAPWPSEETRDLAVAACYDCHSNETEWPVYSFVAPMSWLLRRDVESGRDELNFSTWDDDGDADDAAETIEEGSMPPSQYTLLHPDARLSDDEEAELIAALEAMDEDRGDDDGGGDRSGSNSGPG